MSEAVTSWLRRWVMGALDHQHAPLPQDDLDEGYGPPGSPGRGGYGTPGSPRRGGHGPSPVERGGYSDVGGRYRFPTQSMHETPWYIKWFSSAPDNYPGTSNYAPTLQYDSESHVVRDEQYQMEQAMKRSLEDQRRNRGYSRSDSPYDSKEYDYESEEEEQVRKALELSKKEEEERKKREEEEREREREREEEREREKSMQLATHLPDLLNLNDDLLDFGGASSSSGAFINTENDEAISIALQNDLSLLDHPVGTSEGDLLSQISQQAKEKGSRNDIRNHGINSLEDLAAFGPNLNSQTGALVPVIPPKNPVVPSAYASSTCGGCARFIESGRFLTCLGSSWHPQCFKCKGCDRVIADREFKVMERTPYHSHCYKNLFHPKCVVCEDHIAVEEGGVIKFCTHPFWGDKYCTTHQREEVPSCAACRRMEPKSTPFASLDDGRRLCLSCLGSVVVDTNDCAPLFDQVLQFYSQLGMKISQTIPLMLVETQALNTAMQGEKNPHHHNTETRGLCVSEEQTIQTIVRLPGSTRGGLFGGIGELSVRVHRQCEVTAILVLYGLPRLLTGSILAHELMHAWIRLDGNFPPLSPEVEEGLCQSMSFLWLQSQLPAVDSSLVGTSSSTSNGGTEEYDQKFAEFCMYQIATNPSQVYGEGFRRSQMAVVQMGVKSVVEHVKRTATFP